MLCIIRLEIHRIQAEAMCQHMQVTQHNSSRQLLICPICYDVLSTSHIAVTSQCGHVYCSTCYSSMLRQAGHACGFCRVILSTVPVRLYIRFNFRSAAICRACGIEFTQDSNVGALRCGDVFCQNCLHAIRGPCLGCGSNYTGTQNTYRLHLSFHEH